MIGESRSPELSHPWGNGPAAGLKWDVFGFIFLLFLASFGEFGRMVMETTRRNPKEPKQPPEENWLNHLDIFACSA